MLYTTLWDNNTTDLVGPGGVGSVVDIPGEAKFNVDGYHLLSWSDAVGKGLTGDVATGSDVDGENRFQGNGPELGADELPATCAAIVGESAAPVYNTVQEAIDAAPVRTAKSASPGRASACLTHGGLQQAIITKDLTLRGGYATSDWQTSRPRRRSRPCWMRQAAGASSSSPATCASRSAGLTLINGSASGQGDGPGGGDAGGNLLVDATRVTLDQMTHGQRHGHGRRRALPEGRNGNRHRQRIPQQRRRHQAAVYIWTPQAIPSSSASNRFVNNNAQDGGGLYAAGGSPLLLANQFTGNTANLGQGGGGGAYLNGGTPRVQPQPVGRQPCGGRRRRVRRRGQGHGHQQHFCRQYGRDRRRGANRGRHGHRPPP